MMVQYLPIRSQTGSTYRYYPQQQSAFYWNCVKQKMICKITRVGEVEAPQAVSDNPLSMEEIWVLSLWSGIDAKTVLTKLNN